MRTNDVRPPQSAFQIDAPGRYIPYINNQVQSEYINLVFILFILILT